MIFIEGQFDAELSKKRFKLSSIFIELVEIWVLEWTAFLQADSVCSEDLNKLFVHVEKFMLKGSDGELMLTA